MQDTLTLKINGFTLDETREVLEKVREIEQRDPKRLIFVQLNGLEKLNLDQAKDIMQKIFPDRDNLSTMHPSFYIFQQRKRTEEER